MATITLAKPDFRLRIHETPNTTGGGPHAEVYLPAGDIPEAGAPVALFIHG